MPPNELPSAFRTVWKFSDFLFVLRLLITFVA